MKSENPQAVDSALTCLHLFGVDLPAHPTWEQVQLEYETVWQTLDGRPIESLIARLIDLPLMTDPEAQAVMQMFAVVGPPAYLTDFHVFCLIVCRMVKIGMQHGMCGAFAHGLAGSGRSSVLSFAVTVRVIVSPSLHATWSRQHGFIAYEAKVYFVMGIVGSWTQPIGDAHRFQSGSLSRRD